MIFFLGGSILCGLSSSMIQLVVFRALQGIFDAVLTAASLAGPVPGGLAAVLSILR
jgi:MFS family permease